MHNGLILILKGNLNRCRLNFKKTEFHLRLRLFYNFLVEISIYKYITNIILILKYSILNDNQIYEKQIGNKDIRITIVFSIVKLVN